MQRERIPLIVTNVFLILFIVAAALTHIQCVFEVRVENPKTGDFVIVSAGLWKMCTAAKNSTTSESSCAKLSGENNSIVPKFKYLIINQEAGRGMGFFRGGGGGGVGGYQSFIKIFK